MRACFGSSAAALIRTPIRGMRSRCCARAAIGHADRSPADKPNELASLHRRPQAQNEPS